MGAKEKIGLAILDAETEARIRKEQLEQEQVKDVISKYGQLQEDGDTIKLKDVDAEVSLKDIYNGITSNTGSYTANKEKIEQLEKQVAELEKALEESSKTEGEKAQELTDLKEELAKVTATEDRILKGYTAYKNNGIITGMMEDRGELNWNPSESTSYTIPAGFYSGGTISTANAYTAGYNAGASGKATVNNITTHCYMLTGGTIPVIISPTYTASQNCILIGFVRGSVSRAIYINGISQGLTYSSYTFSDDDGKVKTMSSEGKLVKNLNKGDTFYGSFQSHSGDEWGKVGCLILMTIPR